MLTQYIPDVVKAVVEKVNTVLATRDVAPKQVFFDFGTHEEVMKNLIYKDQNPAQVQKWPLIWLVTPFTEEGSTHGLVYKVIELHFVIAYNTDPNYSMEQRRDNSFKPVLYTVYAELMKQLDKASKQLGFPPGMPDKKMDLQYARLDPSGKNLFNDFVDVIDVKISNVQVKNICSSSNS